MTNIMEREIAQRRGLKIRDEEPRQDVARVAVINPSPKPQNAPFYDEMKEGYNNSRVIKSFGRKSFWLRPNPKTPKMLKKWKIW